MFYILYTIIHPLAIRGERIISFLVIYLAKSRDSSGFSPRNAELRGARAMVDGSH